MRLEREYPALHPEDVPVDGAYCDMPYDLPMLRWAGVSFAVTNAHPDVLAAAGHSCLSNDDDGVARVIESLIAPGRRR
jgi:3-deoxy-D-manno-octulosonate 8-phosphate phosphatase KdsC-like HAD superfamily phosphatase